jgi:hypothetical protein
MIIQEQIARRNHAYDLRYQIPTNTTLLVDFVLQNPYNAPTYERTDVSADCIDYDRDGFHRWDDGYGHVWLLQEGSPDCGKTSVVYL